MTLKAAGLALIAVVGMTGCGGGGGGDGPTAPAAPAAPQPVATVTLEYSAVTMASRQPLVVNVTARDAGGQVVTGKTATWSSSDNAIVSIEPPALIGQAAGMATVTAAIDGKSASAPVTVVKFAAVSAGPLESCALTPGGVLYCSGSAYGARAKPFAAQLRWTQVDSNGESDPSTTCGVTTDAKVFCWGGNNRGQLGVGDLAPRSAPTAVSLPEPAKAVALGIAHSCAVTTAGNIYCWGKGDLGQLGNGAAAGSLTPVRVTSAAKFTHVAGGRDHTCALTTTGEIHCWGANDLGQLGRGPGLSDSPTPQRVKGDLLFTSVSSRRVTTCAVATGGKAYCWGSNTAFELGSTTDETCRDSKPCSSEPREVATTLTFDVVAAGVFGGCGMTGAGAVHCWGLDVQSSLGATVPVPQCPTRGAVRGCTSSPLPGPTGFKTVTGSQRNYCGMRNDGGAYCWGTNAASQLGVPGVTESAVPLVLAVDPTITPP